MWDYTSLPNLFGSEEKSLTFKVENEQSNRSLNKYTLYSIRP
ncbi:Indole-3-pyruvate decarboxylase [Bacillus thuringiensis serovar israelensis ATCC 35646]|nr:Indole-3-pyruvate decarboxylase [Bacillus thuringiensis serovar israelensis ATCC 35646]